MISVLLVALVVTANAAHLDVRVNHATFAFDIMLNGERWLTSTGVDVHCNRKQYDSVAGTLKLSSPVTTFSGSDKLGSFNATTAQWAADDTLFSATIFAYADKAVFRQHFVNGASGTSTGDREGVMASFPRFLFETPAARRGYFAYNDDMVGDAPHFGQWDEKSNPPTGIKGTSPLTMFKQDLSVSSVMSPFANFMVANAAIVSSNGNRTLCYGPLGSLESIPAAFSLETIVVAFAGGPTDAVLHWGDQMLTQYEKTRKGPDFDLTLTYLGYSTDNGAYYYYNTEPDMNYEDTLIAVKKYADSEHIPYKYILLDSWWYPKDSTGAVTEWVSMPSVFPNGLQYLYNQTGWPVQGHNRYWSSETVYAKANGGPYNFHIQKAEGGKRAIAAPDDQMFWDWLLQSSKEWGLVNYEQDWLDDEYDWFDGFTTDATLARRWLMQMGTAAKSNGLTIQYCMSHVRHMLQSIEIPAVTNARASSDYHPGNQQWIVGVTSLLAHAIGVAPSKDNYWTTMVQPGSKWGPLTKEPYNRLESAISSLTRGPVAPADKVGHSDTALIAKHCMPDGRLLRPDHPAWVLDQWVLDQSLQTGKGPQGQLYHSESRLAQEHYAYVIAAELTADYSLDPSLLGYEANTALLALGVNATAETAPIRVSSSAPLQFSVCGKHDFELFTLSPILSNGWAFLGEIQKWVRVSSDRFRDLTETSEGVAVELVGVPGETVELLFFDSSSDKSMTVKCVFGAEHSLTANVPAGTCT